MIIGASVAATLTAQVIAFKIFQDGLLIAFGFLTEVIAKIDKIKQRGLAAMVPLFKFIGISNHLEKLGDIIENNVLVDAIKRGRLGVN